MNYERKSISIDQEHKYQEKARLVIYKWKYEQDMSTTGVDESEGGTLHLYPRPLFYFACGSSHLYGGGLSLKLFSLYPKLFKGCALSCLACIPSRLGLNSKLPKGSTLCLKVPPPLCDNFLEASTT
jgi:hypothetical protein